MLFGVFIHLKYVFWECEVSVQYDWAFHSEHDFHFGLLEEPNKWNADDCKEMLLDANLEFAVIFHGVDSAVSVEKSECEFVFLGGDFADLEVFFLGGEFKGDLFVPLGIV